ncbi:MAG: 6-phosphogluconolactonase [Pseudomonadota bacterium]
MSVNLRNTGPGEALPLHCHGSADALADAVAAHLVRRLTDTLKRRARIVFVPSSGRTPGPIYARLRARYAAALDWSRVHILQMDEYADPDLPPPARFRAYLERELVRPLRVGGFTCLDTARGRRDAERLADRIDLVLHGIGSNGHLAFNEPGAEQDGVLRQVLLSRRTMADNFGPDHDAHPLPFGYTLGLEALSRADCSLLVATGAHKAPALDALFGGATVRTCPAAILRDARLAGRDVAVYADTAAAASIGKRAA